MKKRFYLLFLALIPLIGAPVVIPKPEVKVDQVKEKIVATPTPEPVYEKVWLNERPEIMEIIEETPIKYTYTVMVKEYVCDGYITSYTAEECGWNYETASGATVHYEEDPYEPTTVAIDPRYFDFGDLFWIDVGDGGRLYVAEDTGGAVKKYHWDVYRDTMSEVRSFPTGYYPVYAVHYETREGEVIIKECDYLRVREEFRHG